MKAITVSYVVASLWLPVLCPAAPVPQPSDATSGSEGERRGPRKDFWEAWKAADTDGDGLISRQEFAAMKRIERLPDEKREELFKRLDKNDDGNLSREELEEMAKHREGKHQMMPRLWELDVNKDGEISFEEFKAGEFFKKLPPERQEAIFHWLDANGDGVISPKDRPADQRPGQPGPPHDPRHLFQMLDKNADGFITLDEYRQAPFVRKLPEEDQKARFDKLDRNQDSKIAPDELPEPEHRGDGKARPDAPGTKGGPP